VKVDLHIHSKYSFDSLCNPTLILKFAKRKKIDAISITDHNNMLFYSNTIKSDIIVIKGMEIRTQYGDIIGLFLNEEIQSRNFIEVLQDIRDQGGISFLPHPYVRNIDPNILVKYCDLIEIFNSRIMRCSNNMSINFLNYRNKGLACSDSHNLLEIGNAYTVIENCYDENELKKALLSKTKILYGRYSFRLFSHGLSFISSRINQLMCSSYGMLNIK
jgi:predicted metal-dependent phosphoesterase TrpH